MSKKISEGLKNKKKEENEKMLNSLNNNNSDTNNHNNNSNNNIETINKDNCKSSYHKFQIRNSILEVLIDKTKLNQSEFKGFYNLFMSLFIMYVFSLPLFNYFNYGFFLKTKLFTRMINDLSILILIWPLFHCWTYLAYILEIMIIKGYPNFICTIFRNSTQAGIFIYTTYICLYSNLCTSHKIFTLAQCIIHFFKMHSYTQVNRDYREDFIHKKKTGEKQISSYPQNINFSNFLYFLRAPTFVYEESYPRSPNFNFTYFILKLLKAFFFLTCSYYVYTEFLEDSISLMITTSIFELIYRIYAPIFVLCFLLFYLIFECVLPGYAELSTFGDRQFYDDWWNSTDLEEFNRRWNKIVHMFLYRHVYLEATKKYNFSPTLSKLITFLVSAFFHEYCLCVIIGLFRPFMFSLMMLQLPLIDLGKKYLSKTTGGNYFVWLSLLIGNPLIFILYNRAYLYEYGHIY